MHAQAITEAQKAEQALSEGLKAVDQELKPRSIKGDAVQSI